MVNTRLDMVCNFSGCVKINTCRNLQAKVIKTAAFCHNRALQDLSPDSYGCCSQQDLSLRQPHRFRK